MNEPAYEEVTSGRSNSLKMEMNRSIPPCCPLLTPSPLPGLPHLFSPLLPPITSLFPWISLKFPIYPLILHYFPLFPSIPLYPLLFSPSWTLSLPHSPISPYFPHILPLTHIFLVLWPIRDEEGRRIFLFIPRADPNVPGTGGEGFHFRAGQ